MTVNEFICGQYEMLSQVIYQQVIIITNWTAIQFILHSIFKHFLPYLSIVPTVPVVLYPLASWVELDGFSTTVASRRDSVIGPQGTTSSLLQGELERILLDAQLECERSTHADRSEKCVQMF